MSTTEKRSFNADAKTRERTDEEIVIGGKVWHPRARNGQVAREIALLGKPPEDMKEGDEAPPERLPEILGYMYRSLAVLIADDEGNQPDSEWLADHLEWTVGNELMTFLNPDVEVPPTPTPLQVAS